MQTYNIQVFDDIVAGAGPWYTSADVTDTLGTADAMAIAATTTLVGGTSPTLTVQVEHSPDGQNWTALGFPAEIAGMPISEFGTLHGQVTFFTIMLAFVRLRISLGGTTPTCRLTLFVTGRQRGV